MIAALLIAVASLAPGCYPPPVDAPIAVPFREPACDYCPGHRGVEYDLAAGTRVSAVAGGVVRFAGTVAHTRYLVVAHDDGLLATYGMLLTIEAAVGDRVTTGGAVGTSTRRLYLGLRDRGRYIDPAGMLGRWRARPRLVPVDGSPRRPGGAARLACPGMPARPPIRDA